MRPLLTTLHPLLNKNRQAYHIANLLQSKYEEQQMKLQPTLFHLYLHKLQTSKFNERFLIVLAVDCYRTKQPFQKIDQIVNCALANLHKFQSRITIVVLLNQIYLYKYANKEVIDRLVRRAFEIQEKEDSGYTFFNLKLVILINQLMKLEQYPEELYRRINFKKFKPLSLAMVLQMFYQSQLEDRYPIVHQLVDIFVACEAFVPFADVHHLSYAIRKINNQKFRECFYRIRRRIQGTLNKKSSEDMSKNEQGQWTTDEELLQQFRKNIENKYRLIQ